MKIHKNIFKVFFKVLKKSLGGNVLIFKYRHLSGIITSRLKNHQSHSSTKGRRDELSKVSKSLQSRGLSIFTFFKIIFFHWKVVKQSFTVCLSLDFLYRAFSPLFFHPRWAVIPIVCCITFQLKTDYIYYSGPTRSYLLKVSSPS
jgi:hypothetical protein